MVVTTTVTLSTGAEIPRLGLGVFQAPAGEATGGTVLEALRVGHLQIATAMIYGNEEDVGKAIRESPVPRSEIFVTTKLWNTDQGCDRALRAFDACLARLGASGVDLYPIHWPMPDLRRKSRQAL